MTMRAWRRGALPRRGRARRGEDPPGARPRPRAAARRRRAAGRGRLPDGAADPPVGRGRRPARRAPRPRRARAAPAAGLRRRRRDLRAGGDASAERWSRQCGARRSSSPTRPTTSARTSPGAWGSPSPSRDAGRRLLLSGTPFRSDADADPGRPLRRRRRRARRLLHLRRRGARRICRPVTFVPYDGVLQWRQRRRRGRVVLRGRADRPRRRRAATGPRSRSTSPTGCRGSWRRRTSACRRVRAGGHRDAGGLVVAADGEHARAVAKVLREITGAPPVVVLHTEARAAREAGRRSPRSREPWIVAVNMVSEGVDIPRLRVGVYATAAKTPLIFRQIVGRFVRTIPGAAGRPQLAVPPRRPGAPPARERRRDRAAPRPAPARRGGPGGARRARPSGARASASEREAFVPVAADVAPQLALFGGGAAAPAPVAPGRCRRRAPRTGQDADERRAPGVGAARAAARQAPPARRRPAPPRRAQPRGDQRLAEPQLRHPPRERRVDRAARALHRAPARRARRRALAGARRRAGSARRCRSPPGPGPAARSRPATPRPAGRRRARPRGGGAPRGRRRPRRRAARGRPRSGRSAGAR